MKKLVAPLLVLAVAAPALAHDHKPPTTYLWNEGRRLQRGILITWCWEQGADHDHHSVGQCADGVDRFSQKPATVPAGDTIAIRLESKQRPRELSLRTYPTGDTSAVGYMTGEDLPVRLQRRSGAWHVVFTLTRPCSHHYLRFSAVWPDVQTRAAQDAYYTFHAVTTASGLGDVAAPLCAIAGSL